MIFIYILFITISTFITSEMEDLPFTHGTEEMPEWLEQYSHLYGVTSAQADLCRVNPKDPFFHVVDLSLKLFIIE